MKLEKRKPSGREKDEASIKLLAQLREKLYSEHVGTARQTAFNLSWMQEDGLDILREALFSKASRSVKSAAAYGMRKMRGRMQKAALEILSLGLKHYDKSTAVVCQNALLVLMKRAPGKLSSEQKIQASRFEIRQIKAKSRFKKSKDKVNRSKNIIFRE